MNSIEITSNSVEQTIDLGKTLGRQLGGGELIALIGNLGTGKTHLIKGLAMGLDVYDADSVASPTFTLINEYEGRLMLYHIDAYRFDNPSQLEALGFDELCCGPGVTVIEWADKVQSLIDLYPAITIHLEHCGPTTRYINISNLPDYVTL
ncbi:MAG: tRNA (adenosine(37)-N6)-threonylcarbamoyltransferase complex ATPase subunit type 1 TsaE [Phycisphaerae bacterium]|nr:tRNA (adenosine(37)-N6)-threonylcarbamoyltransferase complex ATPase subunit type 1 TsaE [Phycisphaerae bacterium]